MQRQYSAAERQRKIQISRKAWKTVQVNQNGVSDRPGSSAEEHAVNLYAAGWNLHRRPDRPGTGNKLRPRAAERERGENCDGR
jgi:hypothetical protein